MNNIVALICIVLIFWPFIEAIPIETTEFERTISVASDGNDLKLTERMKRAASSQVYKLKKMYF